MFVSNFPHASLYMLDFDKTGIRELRLGVEQDWILHRPLSGFWKVAAIKKRITWKKVSESCVGFWRGRKRKQFINRTSVLTVKSGRKVKTLNKISKWICAAFSFLLGGHGLNDGCHGFFCYLGCEGEGIGIRIIRPDR